MESIGAEVGQKMRSAIKAKLMELDCYVDDELPDYIMVMVANKRTKSQMNEDLNLFLSQKTSTFVDWLHIVLKRLKEVAVTNPEVFKKIPNTTEAKVKKEKKSKSKSKKAKNENSDKYMEKSLTDDLPINANKLTEKRKITVMQENQGADVVNEDNFDIPPLSQVADSNEAELADIEQKIRSVKSRLGLIVDSDSEDADFLSLKPDPDDLLAQDSSKKQMEQSLTPPRPETPKELLEARKTDSVVKKKSVLERLGKRATEEQEGKINSVPQKRTRISITETRLEEERILGLKRFEKENERRKDEKERPKESVMNRLGVMSKVSVPIKENVEKPSEEEIPLQREVQSVIKVKPRVLPPRAKQANKNLLLKAVAEAQRSVAQTPQVGSNKLGALFTKKYKQKQVQEEKTIKLPEKEKSKLKNMLISIKTTETDETHYTPKPVTHTSPQPNVEYVPTTKTQQQENQKFIVTFTGMDINEKQPIAGEPKKRRAPSPIIFDETTPSLPAKQIKPSVPDKLPTVLVKNKERCRYWPGCKQGEMCEYVHPVLPCKMFPQCKFGEKCLYIHPSCKFAASCTRRECPYSHGGKAVTAQSQQICKFYPNCVNLHCAFYHPKLCKYGQYCKNKNECSFAHNFVATKGSLTWHSSSKS